MNISYIINNVQSVTMQPTRRQKITYLKYVRIGIRFAFLFYYLTVLMFRGACGNLRRIMETGLHRRGNKIWLGKGYQDESFRGNLQHAPVTYSMLTITSSEYFLSQIPIPILNHIDECTMCCIAVLFKCVVLFFTNFFIIIIINIL